MDDLSANSNNDSIVKPEHLGKGTPKRRWLRRFAKACLALLVVVVCLAILLKTSAFWGKPLVARYIAAQVGMPTTIEFMSVTLNPLEVSLQNIHIGDDAVYADIETCLVHTNPLEPVVQQSTVALVEATGISVHLPGDFTALEAKLLEITRQFSGRTEGVSTAAGAPRPETPAFDVHIDLDNITVYKGDELAATGYVSLVNLLSATMQVSWNVDAPLFRSETQFSGALRLNNDEEGRGISGEVNLVEFHVNDLLKQMDRTASLVSDLPDVVVNAIAVVEGVPASQVSVSLNGKLNATDAEVVAGDFSGVLWYDPEKLTLNDFVWTSPGLNLSGDGNYNFDGQLALQMPKAQIEGDPLDVLLALAPTGAFRLSGGRDAQINLSDLLLGMDEQGNLRFSKGGLTFQHIVAIPEGEKIGLGNFEGAINIAENNINIERITGEGLRASGSVRPDIGKDSAVLSLNGELDLATLVKTPLGPSIPLQGLTGKLNLKELTATISTKEGLSDNLTLQLALENVGGSYTPSADKSPIRLNGVNGTMQYAKGELAIAELTGKGLRLNGKVKPNWDKNQARVDLKGDMDLSAGLLSFILPVAVSSMSGDLTIDQFGGTFASGGGLPSDLQLSASLRGGGVQIKTDSYSENLSNVESQFSTDGKTLKVNASASGERVGAVSLAGNCDLVQSVFKGDIQCSPNMLMQPYLSGQSYPILLASLLNAYSPASLDVLIELPSESRKNLSVSLGRVASPTMQANFDMEPIDGAYRIGNMKLTTDCPLNLVDFRELPYAVTGADNAAIMFEHTSTTRSFNCIVDLQYATLGIDPYFKKNPGDDMRIVLQGSSDPAWTLGDIHVTLLGEQLVLARGVSGLRAENLSMNLAQLARCFPNAQAVSGQIQGSFQTSPLDIDLTLQGVKAQLGVPLPVSEVDGVLRYNDHYLECRNLRVLGEKNDFTANGNLQDGMVQASIVGGSLDIDSFMAYYAAMSGDAQQPLGDTDTPASASAAPTYGAANINLREVYYMGEQFKDVKADITLSEQEILIENLHVVPKSGSVSGMLKVAYPTTPSRRHLESDLTLNEADMSVLDKWINLEPRGVYGTASGSIRMTIPYSETGVVYNGLNGTVNVLMQNGSFGKMGFASRMTTAMRSTEIIQLRAPHLKDKGLTFDNSTLNLTATNGVIEIDPFDLKSPSYEIKATGVINYPDDNMDVNASFNALEGVTGITQNIPVIGQTLDTIRGVTDLNIHITGSPFNPQYRVGSRVIEGGPPTEPESGVIRPGERLRELLRLR